MSEAEASEVIDLYLDRLLSPEESSRFEARMQIDAGLRAAVETQRRLDGSLRKAFAPPTAPEALDPVVLRDPIAAAHVRTTAQAITGKAVGMGGGTDAPTLSISVRRRKATLVRIAAAIAIVVLGGYTFHMSRVTAFVPVAPVAAYEKELSAGFRPYEVCENDQQVATLTTRAIGTALSIAAAADVHLVGWGYKSNVLSEDTVTLLATAGTDKIVIYMDRAAADRFLPEETDPNVNVFRREAFGAVFYEVSPRDEATILPLIQKAPG